MNFIMFIQRYKVYFLFLKHKWIQLKQTEISIYSTFHILVCLYAALFWLNLNIYLLVIWRGLNTTLKCPKKFQFDQESGRRKTTSWMCYLQIQRYKVYVLFLKHKWIQLKQTEISIYSTFHILVCLYAALFWLNLNIYLLVIWRGLNTTLKCPKKFQFDQESGRRKTTSWMCYLQIILSFFL